MILRLLLFLFLITSKISFAQVCTADAILGEWTDEKKEVRINCYKENGKYYSKLLWVENLKDKGKPLPKNEQHWINMIVMKDFVYSNGEWNNGKIYTPKTDKTYSAYIKYINANTIQVTGYLWLRIFSESHIFNRIITKKKTT